MRMLPMMVFRIAVLAFATLIASGETLFGRVEFVLTNNGREIQGGEVCFFHSSAVAQNVAPDRFYFSSADVRCLPAQTVLDTPPGLFMIFARHAAGYVSPSRNVQYAAEPSGPGCYQKVDVAVVPSALLDFAGEIDSGSNAGVWVGDTDRSLGMFLPAVSGENTIQVPAGMPIIPLKIRGNRPERLGAVLTLGPGERQRVKFPAAGQRGDVVGWLLGADEAVRGLNKRNLVLDDPQIVLLDSAAREIRPQNRLRHPGSFNGSLVFFRDVTPGKASLSISGRLWKSETITIDVAPGAVTVPKEGLAVYPAAAIRVLVPAEIAGVTPNTCDQERAMIKVFLDKCLRSSGGENDPARCAPYRELNSEVSIPAIEFSGVPEGSYDVRATMETRLIAHQSLLARPGQEIDVHAEPVGPIVYGRVRRGEKPVRAELTFGTGDRTTSNSDGEFRAILKASPGTHPITIRTCNEGHSYVHLLQTAPSPYAPLAIDLAENALLVSVRDAATGKALAASHVKYAVLAEGDDGEESAESFTASYSQSAVADDHGGARFEGVIADRRLRVCASAPDYRPACTRALTLKRTGEQRVQVDLRSRTSLVGRFIATGHPEGTSLFLMSLDGRLVANANVGSDGMFIYEAGGLTEGFAVIVSPSLPMSVVRFIADATQDVAVVVKAEATVGRTFMVEVTPREPPLTARIGLRIDGVLIPANAFGDHQGARGRQSVLMNGRPLEVADIAAAQEIVVILGPDPRDHSYPPDAVGRPEYAPAFPSHALHPGDQIVRFE